MEKRPYTELYLHIPFCAGKCHYCAFYSEGKWSMEDMEDFTRHLLKQLQLNSPSFAPLRSIYLGGGTPTLLPPPLMEKILSSFARELPLSNELEISCECNPESLTNEMATILGKYVHRVTMGVQSFSTEKRKFIGRKGDVASIEKAVTLLMDNGIKNIGLDLIYALPFQTLEEWKKDLEKALTFPISHLSCYALSLEEGTILHQKNLLHPFPENADLEAEMWDFTGNFLRERGFPRYEISNYALPGKESRHNFHIWEGATYLGLGPGGCSFDGKVRFMEPPSLSAWLNGKEVEKDEIAPITRLAELFIMGLRKCNGWEEDIWLKLTPHPWKSLFPSAIERGIALGLLREKEKALLPTEKGLAFWNDLAELFL